MLISNSALGRKLALIALAATLLVLAGCASGQSDQDTAKQSTAEKKDTPPKKPPPAPEPAEASPLEKEPAGKVVDLGDSPEGIAADPETGLVAVGLRNPDELALVDGESGEVLRRVELPDSARHLQIAGPGGPVLVPAERADALVQVGLPDGEIVSETPVGDFPHDAAASGGKIFVANEFGNTASVIEDGRELEKIEAPLQPGGVAATPDGLVGIVGVRGLSLEVFEADTLKSLGRMDAGEGPTHVVAGPENRFYVTDTRGDAVLVYEARPELEQLGRIPLPGSPYGIAIDSERNRLWVTLTATNRVVQYALESGAPREVASSRGFISRMKMTRLFVLTVLLVAILSLAACGGSGQQSGAQPEANGAEAPKGAGSGGGDASGADTKQANSSGEGSEDFSVTTLEGEQFDLSDKRGEVVALFFMAGY